MFQGRGASLRVLLVHPGGPLWRKRDLGAWSIPKGEFSENEPAADAALRECQEELGVRPAGTLLPLGDVRQKGGKIVTAFAVEGEFDVDQLRSETLSMGWPPRSGRTVDFPEVDRAAWYSIRDAKEKINAGQQELLDRLEAALSNGSGQGTA